MKKLLLLLCASAQLAISPFLHAGNGDLRGIFVATDGVTYIEAPTTFAANGILAFGSSPGALVTVSLANYATTASLSSYATVSSLSSYVTTSSLTTTLVPYALTSALPVIRAGSVTVTAALTKAVTFSSAMPNTNYRVTIIPNGLVTSGYAASKTTSGFTLTLPLAITGSVDYIAVGDQ